MISANDGASAVILILFGILQSGECVRCYECEARLRPGETSTCLTGDETQFRRVSCIDPPACLIFHDKNYTTGIDYVKRGCQTKGHNICNDGDFDACIACTADLCNYFKNDLIFIKSSSAIKTIPSVITMIYALAWLCI